MEEFISDELNSKMNNLKSSISEHAIEQVQKKTRRLCLVRVFQGGRNARQLEPVQQALAEFERKKLIDVEYIDIDKVKTSIKSIVLQPAFTLALCVLLLEDIATLLR